MLWEGGGDSIISVTPIMRASKKRNVTSTVFIGDLPGKKLHCG